ncbi:TIGR00282 family metallophosphoesterase [Candidatus Dependentiae bacterium]|nr:TIGR00282 family metallophosphoesterase [Candidatus Dependentiae bacterium]
MKVTFIGDLVGVVGFTMLKRWIAKIKEDTQADLIVVNGENIAGKGRGITPKDADMLFALGAQVITTGNHIWAQKEIYPYINQTPLLIRPANFPDGVPGKGFVQVEVKGTLVTIINLMGRVFFRETLSCPFKKADEIIATVRMKSPIVLVDFHAEATSEKIALGLYLDGKISGMVGTHSHVQTADERILPQGTGFITDLGSSGAVHSCLGMTSGPIIQRFITQLPQQFVVDVVPPYQITGVSMEIDRATGKTLNIKRFSIIDDQKI